VRVVTPTAALTGTLTRTPLDRSTLSTLTLLLAALTACVIIRRRRRSEDVVAKKGIVTRVVRVDGQRVVAIQVEFESKRLESSFALFRFKV
jgi:hypothetical protein